jgi:hypothetical protein
MVNDEPRSGIEPLVADRVEAVMPAEGIQPGPRERHDAAKGMLLVDFLYPQARPQAIALEITGVWDGGHRAGVRTADRITQGLTETAEREHLGSWLVTVRTDKTLRDLEPEIIKVIAAAQPNRERMLSEDDQIRPGEYTSNDLARLPSSKAERLFIQEHDRLKRLGLVEVKPIRADREHAIAVFPMTGGDVVGFGGDLEERVRDNVGKLGKVQGSEHHLAVFVDRHTASRSSELTPPPLLPPEIDFMWVVHGWRDKGGRYATWVTRRGESQWRIYSSDEA